MSDLAILILAQFGAMFPLFIWLVPVRVVQGGFVRFTLSVAMVTLTLSSALLFVSANWWAGGGIGQLSGWPIRALSLAALALLVTGFTWQRPQILRIALTPVLFLWGISLSQGVLSTQAFSPRWMQWGAVLLGGSALGSVSHGMILGHWYLNVPGLPIRYLQRSTRAIYLALGLQLGWAITVLATTQTIVGQRLEPAFRLLGTFEGLFLWMGLGLGLMAPLLLNILISNTARIHSTQSATGLLYVAMLMVVMGALTLGSYLLRLGLAV